MWSEWWDSQSHQLIYLSTNSIRYLCGNTVECPLAMRKVNSWYSLRENSFRLNWFRMFFEEYMSTMGQLNELAKWILSFRPCLLSNSIGIDLHRNWSDERMKWTLHIIFISMPFSHLSIFSVRFSLSLAARKWKM